MTKAEVMAMAQRDANRDGQAHAVVNLNPYNPQWVCRELQIYHPQHHRNDTLNLFIRPAPGGCYILTKNGKPAMNFAGRVPVYLDSQHVQQARDQAATADPKGDYGYRPIDIAELHDREWYYV